MTPVSHCIDDFAAVVMAGGRSTRMGRDKAFLSVGGVRLIDRQLNLLTSLHPRECLISGRAGVDYARADVRVVTDVVADAGPLGGLLAVLEATRATHVLMLAVDMPRMSSAWLKGLLAASSAHAGAVSRVEGRWEPLAAVYPRSVQEIGAALLARNERRMSVLIEEAHCAGMLNAVDASVEQSSLFSNWNSPSDLGSGQF